MQYRSIQHVYGLMELLCRLRVVPMFWAFLAPVGHLPLDDPRVDAVAPWRQHFLGNFGQQVVVPSLQPRATLRTPPQPPAHSLHPSRTPHPPRPLPPPPPPPFLPPR